MSRTQLSFDRLKSVLFILLSFVVIFTVADLIEDFASNPSWLHMSFEIGVVIASTSALGWLVFERRVSQREVARLGGDLARLGGDLASAQADAEHWRAEARQVMSGLSAAIDRQFDVWKLTPAEKEIGMLLLKGLALKEAAEVRGTSERTVRHQAQEIYRKAGLSGRADFAAFFLEDLLLPSASRPAEMPSAIAPMKV